MTLARVRLVSGVRVLALGAVLLLPALGSAAPSDLAAPELEGLYLTAGNGPLLLAVLDPGSPVALRRGWDPVLFREQVLRLIPTEALGDIARTLVEQKVQLRVDREQAFVSLRIPLG